MLHLVETQCQDNLDIQVLLGVTQKVDCRLLAVKVEEKVAKVRRCTLLKEAQRKGTKVSIRTLKLANVLIWGCTIPHELWSIDEAFVLMRTRCLVFSTIDCRKNKKMAD